MAPAPKLAPDALKQSLDEMDQQYEASLATRTRQRRVQELAYQYWEERGYPQGSPEDDWFRAEREIAEQDV